MGRHRPPLTRSLAILFGHTGTVQTINFSPDGHTVATTGRDHLEARPGETDVARIIEQACNHPKQPAIISAD